MPPNLEVHVPIGHFDTCAVPFIESVTDVKNNKSFSADSGETISLASKRQERLRSQSDEEPSPTHGTVARVTYNLDRYDKNAMLIIHNNFYTSSDNTVDKVKSTFENFRFEVEVLDNKKRTEILSALQNFFGRDFTKYGSAAVVVICPLAANGDYKTKRQLFSDDDILKYFKDEETPTLAGKPKILISEANKLNLSNKEVMPTRDVFNLRLQKREKNGKVTPYYLRTFCERLEELADTTDLVAITDNICTLSYRRDHNPAEPILTVIGTLKKELWLWRTA